MGATRSPSKIDQRRNAVAKIREEDRDASQEDVRRRLAHDYGFEVSIATVKRDLRAVGNEWRATRIKRVDLVMEESVERLEQIFRSAQRAWEESGDHKFLAEMRKVVREITGLYGLRQPEVLALIINKRNESAADAGEVVDVTDASRLLEEHLGGHSEIGAK